MLLELHASVIKWLAIITVDVWPFNAGGLSVSTKGRKGRCFYQKLANLGYIHNSYAKHFWHWQSMQQLFQWDICYFRQVKVYLLYFLKWPFMPYCYSIRPRGFTCRWPYRYIQLIRHFFSKFFIEFPFIIWEYLTWRAK